MIWMRRAQGCRAAFAAVALAAATVLGACATFQIEGSFDGLHELTDSAPLPGDPVRLFIIHGITSQQNNYADTLVASVASRLALTIKSTVDQPYPVPGAVGYLGAPPEINLRTYRLYAGDEERLRVSALNWSPLTESIKQHQFEADDQLSRASINAEIKTKVINDGLSDAVLFLGNYHWVMRRGVMIGLCAFLDGDLKGEDCLPNGHSRAPVALISESLGSFMLLDAIERLDRTTQLSETSAAGAPFFSRLRLFYMFANQVPQLELSELNGTPPSGTAVPPKSRFRLFFELVRKAHARRYGGAHFEGQLTPAGGQNPLAIVAFTDPNDLLSYELRSTDVPPDVQNSYQPANVLSPNEIAWFDLFADPLTAHTGYSSNEQVLDLVICGTAGCAK
jgi:hypothetical protein